MNKSRILKEANEAAKLRDKDSFVLIFDEKNINSWKAFVFGPDDSPFVSGIFELAIRLPQNYPIMPPQITFKTRIFHPNIHWENGDICLNVVKDEWSPYWTLEALCRAVQQLMSNPNADSPLNCDAGNLVRSGDKDAYENIAKMLTAEYAIDKKEFSKNIQAQLLKQQLPLQQQEQLSSQKKDN